MNAFINVFICKFCGEVKDSGLYIKDNKHKEYICLDCFHNLNKEVIKDGDKR
jgi:hypothetical protein